MELRDSYPEEDRSWLQYFIIRLLKTQINYDDLIEEWRGKGLEECVLEGRVKK